MTEFLLFVIAVTLLYIAWKIPRDKMVVETQAKEAERKQKLVKGQLPGLQGRLCEFVAKDMTVFPNGMTGKGTVLDFDDEWVLVSIPGRKGDVRKVVRISQIDDVREIR